MTEYSCDYCDYTSCRKYNVTRHMTNMHKSTNEIITLNDLQCKDCLRIYASKYTFDRHLGKCTKIAANFECQKCKDVFASKKSLANHNRLNTCKSKEIATTSNTQNVGQMNVNNGSIQTQNNNNTTVNLLVFPNDGDDTFDFSLEHIQDAVMKRFINQRRPSVGFEMFIDKILENPTNKIIYKTNPNTKYSKIHKGNNQFEFAADTKVLPVLTHHMTTAALQKVNAMKPKPIFRGIREKAQEFVQYIDEVNTNDESREYTETLETIKLILVNMFLRDKND